MTDITIPVTTVLFILMCAQATTVLIVVLVIVAKNYQTQRELQYQVRKRQLLVKGDQAEEIKSAIAATTQMVQAVKNDALNQKQLELDEFRLRNNIPLEMKP